MKHNFDEMIDRRVSECRFYGRWDSAGDCDGFGFFCESDLSFH